MQSISKHKQTITKQKRQLNVIFSNRIISLCCFIALEAQLENEHEERTLLLREKHSLERRLAETAEAGRTERQGDEALLQRLKRDLRRTKALLRDAQTMLERNKADNPGKAVIRQLRNQVNNS